MIKKITSNNRRVFDSGSVFLYDQNSSVIFTEEIGVGFTILVELAFSNDEGRERQIDKEVDLQKNYIKYTCFGFDNPLGTGTTVPIEIATYNNKKVEMHFWSFLLGNKETTFARRIDYSFYIEK